MTVNIPEFNRRRVLIPMLAGVILVSVAFFVSEAGRTVVMQSAQAITAAQERMRLLAELAYAAADAESGQRGYLLTHQPEYREPYEEAVPRIRGLITQLQNAYQGDSEERDNIAQIKDLIEKKLKEMQFTLQLDDQVSGSAAVRIVKNGEGLRWMRTVRDEVEGIRMRERQHINEDIQRWQRQHLINRYIAAGGSLLNIVLILVVGIFVTRDIERRTATTQELEHEVAQRTEELSELSTHLQQISESEKANLARELHDELGGLLVAIKMDLTHIGKQIDLAREGIALRWQRVMSAINAGVDLKRRVIEELRPTLLDNMGLIAALQWQAEQTCNAAELSLQASFPDAEPNLDSRTAIAAFRVVQEALTNVVKHAQARSVKLSCRIDSDILEIAVEDDGKGLPDSTQGRSGVHGLTSMKHRVRSIGGILLVGNVEPHGAKILMRVPVSRG